MEELVKSHEILKANNKKNIIILENSNANNKNDAKIVAFKADFKQAPLLTVDTLSDEMICDVFNHLLTVCEEYRKINPIIGPNADPAQFSIT